MRLHEIFTEKYTFPKLSEEKLMFTLKIIKNLFKYKGSQFRGNYVMFKVS